MAWYDFLKVFSYASTQDPLSALKKPISGAGVSQADALDLRNSGGSGGLNPAMHQTELMDIHSVMNRMQRYAEYERLSAIPEIDWTLTVYADETCFAGNTRVMTPYGARTLRELAEKQKGDFLVYCYDFQKNDYTLGFAHSARSMGVKKTVRVLLDNAEAFTCTPDHRILLRNGEWKRAGELQYGDELMPFYRIPARTDLTNLKHKQFPRIFTHNQGWITERQFVDQWSGKAIPKELLAVNRYCQQIAAGAGVRDIRDITGNDTNTIKARMERQGFTNQEVKWLGTKPDRRKVINVIDHEELEVFDLTVREHENFATEWGIAHNCQKDENGRAFQIQTKNAAVKKELEHRCFHRKMWDLNQKKLWTICYEMFLKGEYFAEMCIDIDNPGDGVQDLMSLPPETMFRLETVKGRLVEFQQSKEGPDYEAAEKCNIDTATDQELSQSKAIRFAPNQILHFRIGTERKLFYPYGMSIVEPARSPAYQLRLMEDAMLVYRLARAPERLVFYIDQMNITNARGEAFIDRMKDQFKKRKVSAQGKNGGASIVNERFHMPAIDENFWIPIRGNSNTRVESLPGASNLGEIDDVVYFRGKLFVALKMPRQFWNNEDPQSTRLGVSTQDATFARMIERFQSHLEDIILQLCEEHLRLRGVPEEHYEDLVIKMTPASDLRESMKQEIFGTRIGNASTLKSSLLYSDYDILTKIMKIDPDEAKAMLARLNLQKLQELKFQIIGSNPRLVGVGLPGPNETEIGADPTGPSPSLQADDQGGLPPDAQGMRKYMSDDQPEDDTNVAQQAPVANSGMVIPDASIEDIQRFDLEIQDFESEMDDEEIDMSELD